MKTGLTLLVCVVAGLWGCASHGLKPNQFYDKLEPIEKVPQTSSTPNLVVQINNVADEGKSRKNTVELFINDKKVLPAHKIDRAQRNYVHELALASGVYKIKAIYHANNKEKKYKVSTTDGKVRIYPDRSTFLSIALDKKRDGTLKQKKNYFTESDQPFVISQAPTTSTPMMIKSEAPEREKVENNAAVQTVPIAFVNEENQRRRLTPLPQQRITFPDPQQAITSPRPERRLPGQGPKSAPRVETVNVAPIPSQPQPVPVPPVSEPLNQPLESAPVRSDQIALQINTVPTRAEVIVDDKHAGQSPLIIHVDRWSDHVVQISKAGYEDKMKFLDHHQFGQEKKYFMIEKLEIKR